MAPSIKTRSGTWLSTACQRVTRSGPSRVASRASNAASSSRALAALSSKSRWSACNGSAASDGEHDLVIAKARIERIIERFDPLGKQSHDE